MLPLKPLHEMYALPARRYLEAKGSEVRVNALVVVGILALVGLALALRLSLLSRSGWLLEGDDALSALMAIPVLDGDRPIMLKNQTYAAAWEPYAMAMSYAVLASRVSANCGALIGSLALIGTTWFWRARPPGQPPPGSRRHSLLPPRMSWCCH